MLRKAINFWPIFLIFYIFISLFLNYQKSTLKDGDFLNFITNKDYYFFDFSILLLSLLLNIGSLFVVSLMVYLGFYLAKVAFNLKMVFVLNLIANFIFFIPSAFELIFEKENLKRDLSLYSVLFDNSMSIWFNYPLISFNLFELFYVLLFSFFLSKSSQSHFDDNLRIVLLSYGGIFLLWIVFILFISLN